MNDNKLFEEEQRNKTCCFIGGKIDKAYFPKIRPFLKKAIKQAISDGYTIFISGMSRGTEISAAEIILDERKENAEIELWCASPYRGFEDNWNEDQQKRYKKIIESADKVKFVCKKYVPSCFQTRNVYMLEQSNLVISAFSFETGMEKTIAYTHKNNIKIVNILK